MMCSVPPVVYPASASRLSVSATMPWPGNDAPPWTSTASATVGSWMPAPVERSVCSARVRPSTTGSTASRWLGFAASVTVSLPALELAQDRLVRLPERVREHAQAPPVCHADHDLVRTALGGELDRLVEHRH